MRILVTGWHGQVALALSEAAARRNDISAYAVGRPALDLTDRPSIGRTLFGIAPDVIINTAAYTDVEGAEREPHLAFRRNTEGAAALAQQAARIGIPIIHLSTVYVFDGEKPTAYAEDDNTNPINVYGLSKRDGELAVIHANPKHIILRTGWVYSPFRRNFVTAILQRAAHETELHIDDDQRGSPTYAPHLADAILDIATKITGADQTNWGTYHIADTETAGWCDLGREVFRLSQASDERVPAIIPAPSDTNHAPRPRNATLNCTKLQDIFGIQMPSWRVAIKDCVQRINSNGS